MDSISPTSRESEIISTLPACTWPLGTPIDSRKHIAVSTCFASRRSRASSSGAPAFMSARVRPPYFSLNVRSGLVSDMSRSRIEPRTTLSRSTSTLDLPYMSVVEVISCTRCTYGWPRHCEQNVSSCLTTDGLATPGTLCTPCIAGGVSDEST